MTTPVSRSRSFSLRPPIATEADRHHFQKRLAITLALIFLLAFGFLVAQVIGCAIVNRDQLWPMLTASGMKLQLTITGSAFLGWLFLWKKKRGVVELALADGLSAMVLCTGWAGMIIHDNSPGRSELIALLAVNTTLVARASLLPSTPARTAVIGGLSMLPLLPATYLLHRANGGADRVPAGSVVYVAIWSCVALACTTVLSHVIYGLQLQVRKAMQLGQYRLEEKIGEGGMGAVYRASHTMLRRPTAIKLLTGGTGRAAERFEREVQITAGLTHPNTIAVYDYGRTPDGLFYYAMEYLDGISLEDLVRDFGPQPVPRVVHILLQICGALEEAHQANLVHRDIKPANIMLTERGGIPDVVKVLDFGLVKEADQAAVGLSATGAVMGTPHYMAPESILTPDTIDARADIYALGATAYFLLTGERLFDGNTILAICGKHLHEEPPKLTSKRGEVPAALEAAVLACLAKKPEDRPSSAGALAETLRAAGIPEWSSAEARASKGQARRPVGSRERTGDSRTTTMEGGDTIAVALDGRASA